MRLGTVANSAINSYGQIFFSEKKPFGVLILLVSFIDIRAGMFGFLAVLTANISAYYLGFSKYNISRGIYGFNALLVGLGVGFAFQPSWQLVLLTMAAALLTLFVSLALEGVFFKYGLPFLSLPFILGLWAVMVASMHFVVLRYSERDLYTYNTLFSLGGLRLINIYEFLDFWLSKFPLLKIYFLSLGSIFFQNNAFAGLILSVGLVYHSRIAFSISVLGYMAALGFYMILGYDYEVLSYSYIGFNYILTAIAAGSVFVIPSRRSYFWVLLLLPVSVIVTISMELILANLRLPIYALPFNAMVLLFVYILKLRVTPGKLILNTSGLSLPEDCLYLQTTENKRFALLPSLSVRLPFTGVWTVTQAHNGTYTHKDEWKHAWDFEIQSGNGKTFSGNGDQVTDFFCYSKSVLAPAAGYVVDLQDNIPDNKIGEINTLQNWGNSLVIKHSEYLYSQLSHLKAGSIKVKIGDYVTINQQLAQVGNSGHSPVPHLHFQFQAYSHIGSPTILFPISNYTEVFENTQKFGEGYPVENQRIFNAYPNQLMQKTFRFIPGEIIDCYVGEQKIVWDVKKTTLNQMYIECRETNAVAYFIQTDEYLIFTRFIGDKNSALFLVYKYLYHVKMTVIPQVTYSDVHNPNLFINRTLLTLNDFIAPIHNFLSVDYFFTFEEMDIIDSDSEVKANITVVNLLNKKHLKTDFARLKVDTNNDITLDFSNSVIKLCKHKR